MVRGWPLALKFIICVSVSLINAQFSICEQQDHELFFNNARLQYLLICSGYIHHSKVTKLQSYKVTKLQSYKYPLMGFAILSSGYRSEAQNYKITKLQGCPTL